VFTKDGIRTLTDVVIANPTQANLLPQFCTTQGFATFNVAQAKKKEQSQPTTQLLIIVLPTGIDFETDKSLIIFLFE
jgi:hypothetical protein